jgi:hypothetical protein
MKPLGMDLDEELGILDADFEEILDTGFGELDEMEEAQLADLEEDE